MCSRSMATGKRTRTRREYLWRPPVAGDVPSLLRSSGLSLDLGGLGSPTWARPSAPGALSVVKRDRYITVGIHPALHPASRAILFICDAQQHHDQQPTQAPKNNG